MLSKIASIICLLTLFYKNKNLRKKSDEYFEKLKSKSLPFRLKEILLLNAIDKNNLNEAYKKNEELKSSKLIFRIMIFII